MHGIPETLRHPPTLQNGQEQLDGPIRDIMQFATHRMLPEQLDREKGATTTKAADGPSVRESREAKRSEDRLIWTMLLCGSPLIYLAVDHPSLKTLTIFQAYILTFTVAGILGIKKRAVLRQEWFWTAMLCSLPVHVAAVSVIFYWDKANIEVASKGFYAVGIVWLAGVIEMFCIVGIIELWKPSSEM